MRTTRFRAFAMLAGVQLVAGLILASSRPAQARNDAGTLAPAGENPISWRTSQASLVSSDFSIRIRDTYFHGTPDVRLTSDPGLERSTLEATWSENGIAMGMTMYFERREGEWFLRGLRTRNLDGSDWIEYHTDAGDGVTVSGAVGEENVAERRAFRARSGDAEIRCDRCSIRAFAAPPQTTSRSGYSLSFQIGLPPGQTITLDLDPRRGYGVNAVLTAGEPPRVVLDQSDFTYHWSSADAGIVTLEAQSIPYPDGTCAHGILPPCPPVNISLRGARFGATRVVLDVKRKSTGEIVATNSFEVIVRR